VLAPRGYGRTSFRLAEVVQGGFLPIVVYDDILWVPYRTSIWPEIGFDVQIDQLEAFLSSLKDVPNTTGQEMLAANARYAHLFTFEGVLDEIQLFLTQPSASRLECQKLPAGSGSLEWDSGACGDTKDKQSDCRV
jgi:hypothetical protein